MGYMKFPPLTYLGINNTLLNWTKCRISRLCIRTVSERTNYSKASELATLAKTYSGGHSSFLTYFLSQKNTVRFDEMFGRMSRRSATFQARHRKRGNEAAWCTGPPGPVSYSVADPSGSRGAPPPPTPPPFILSPNQGASRTWPAGLARVVFGNLNDNDTRQKFPRWFQGVFTETFLIATGPYLGFL